MGQHSKVAVVTGARRGLGRALAQLCLSRSMCVVMVDKAWEMDEAVLALQSQYGENVLFFSCDVSVKADVLALVEATKAKYGRVDYLFNNAGIMHSLLPLWSLQTDEIRQVIEVNVFGMIHCIQAFSPLLFQQLHRSHVINIASVYGLCSGSLLSAYAMSKASVVALSESFYFDLQRLNKPVDVSVVCSSFVNTSLLSRPDDEKNTPFYQMLSEWMTRAKAPEDVAEEILKGVLAGKFYVLPDLEVKTYCGERTASILAESLPHVHSLEKLISQISRRFHHDACEGVESFDN